MLEWNGAKFKVRNTDLHRLDGPAIKYKDGSVLWYVNGCLHREDGPAVEYPTGIKEYWIRGYRHREDGPAVEGGAVVMFYLNDVHLWFDEWCDELNIDPVLKFAIQLEHNLF